jgi:hypothetical protein
MPNAPQPFDTGEDQRDLLNWEDKKRFQQMFSAQAVRSYVFLSFGMGLVALMLPVILPAVGGYRGHYSISYFYHVGDLSRNTLVGCLWATGVFLFLFHGLSKLENRLLNVAGAAAIGVAMIPMPPTQANKQLTPHAACAMLFFGCIAIVAVWLSKGRVKYIIYPPKRRHFERAYNAAGFAMIAMPLVVAGLHFLGGRVEQSHWIYWAEALGIWSFSAYWFVKTLEYRLLLRIH